jgi:hypothetical protein
MKLCDYQLAPNPRRVRIFLAEKGIIVPTEQVDLRVGEQFTPEFRAINPECRSWRRCRLTLVAGVGHWLLGSVDWALLGSLVIGSLPGIFFGSHLSAWVPDKGCGRSSQQSSSSLACACCEPEHR